MVCRTGSIAAWSAAGLAFPEYPVLAFVDTVARMQDLVEEMADGVVDVEDVLRTDHPAEPVEADHVGYRRAHGSA